MAEGKSLNLGNLNPIYERELTKLNVHQGRGGEMCLRTGRQQQPMFIGTRLM